VRMKQENYDKCLISLFGLREVIANPAGNRLQRFNEAVRMYLDTRTIYTGEEWVKALRNNDPFHRPEWEKNAVAIHAESYRQFTRIRLDDKTDRPELYDLFRVSGFKPETITARDGDDRYCRNYWVGTKPATGEASPASGNDDLRAAKATG
jgi:hypothetical protein